MQYCAECGVGISTKTERCPLCHKDLPHAECPGTAETYPRYEPRKPGTRRLVRTLSILAWVLIAASTAINLLTWNGNLWCAIVAASVLYAWGPGLLTFRKRVHLALKLMAHAVAMPLLLVVVNTFAYTPGTIHQASWAISYGMPAVFFCFIVAINIIMIKGKHNLKDYLLYQFTLCVIGFTPLILVLCGLAQPLYPSIVTAGSSVVTIITLVIFKKRIIKLEFEKKLHI